MALKSTIYKCELSIADMDRHYYADHPLTVALHPSETESRMMYRLIAFALNAHERLAFTKGISTDDEPDIWQQGLNGEIEKWIDLGQPDEKRIRKACGRAQYVFIYPYNEQSAEIWWQQIKNKLERFNNLTVVQLPAKHHESLTEMCDRNMQISCSIQDGQILWANDKRSIVIEPTALMGQDTHA